MRSSSRRNVGRHTSDRNKLGHPDSCNNSRNGRMTLISLPQGPWGNIRIASCWPFGADARLSSRWHAGEEKEYAPFRRARSNQLLSVTCLRSMALPDHHRVVNGRRTPHSPERPSGGKRDGTSLVQDRPLGDLTMLRYHVHTVQHLRIGHSMRHLGNSAVAVHQHDVFMPTAGRHRWQEAKLQTEY